MTLTEWILFFLVIQVIHFLGTWKLYIKAGRKPWEAAVPVYNAVVLMQIINRPKWWVILLFIPIVNLIMFPVVWVETLRSFRKNTTKDTILAVVTLGFYIYYVNYFENVTHRPDRSLKPTTEAGETVSSILFAVVVATIIHSYFIQPFTIPTSSLEKTLLVGDFLFVSKVNYGARTPQTAVAFPMVHDTIPLAKVKSYSTFPQLPKFRLPGFEKPEHNDIVVFNWPTDTVYQFFDPLRRHVDKPLDKRSNYVKRLVGMPGDSFSIKDGIIHINGEVLQLDDRAKVQYAYLVDTQGQQLDGNILFNQMKLNPQSIGIHPEFPNKIYFGELTYEEAEQVRKLPNVVSVEKYTQTRPSGNIKNQNSVFPHNNSWTIDNMGPLHIPAKGDVVELNDQTLPLYERLIKVYENNDLVVDNGKIFINGQLTNKYTIKQDYYYMMGDNRHNSEDSRMWGFVPEDHIVGKPVFIWFSINSNEPSGKLFDKIRWDRLFTTVHGSGKPHSFFIYFIIALIGWGVYSFIKWRKNKKSYY